MIGEAVHAHTTGFSNNTDYIASNIIIRYNITVIIMYVYIANFYLFF